MVTKCSRTVETYEVPTAMLEKVITRRVIFPRLPLALLERAPKGLRLEAICEALGVTRTEARRPLTTLAEGGRVHKVGHRWRVKAAR